MDTAMDNIEGEPVATRPTPIRRRSRVNEEWIMQQHNTQQEFNAQLLQGLADIRASLHTPNPQGEHMAPIPEVAGGVSGGSRKPKHTLTPPNKFDGQDRAAYPAFRGYLKVKFKIDSDAIGGETEKVWYGYGFLTGKAAKRIYPWLAANEERQRPLRVSDFFAQLDAAFSDPQEAQRALEWINSNKQKNQPFRDFLQEFEQKLLEAGGWEFSDGVRKGYLRAAISKKIKGELVAVEEPASYEDFVKQLQRTSDNLEELSRLGSNRETWTKRHNSPDLDQSSSMDWEPTPKVSYGSAPSRLRDDRRPAKWVTKEVLDQRRSQQKCLRCGGDDHFINRCRLAPAKRPTVVNDRGNRQPRAAASAEPTSNRPQGAKKQKAKVEELSSDSSSELDSGNE
jgi:hypothetical protein